MVKNEKMNHPSDAQCPSRDCLSHDESIDVELCSTAQLRLAHIDPPNVPLSNYKKTIFSLVSSLLFSLPNQC